MARKIRADRDVQSTSKAGARKRADAVFRDAGDDPSEINNVVHLPTNLATDSDLRRYFMLIQSQERDYEKVKAKTRADMQSAKSELDRIYADAADTLKSRGVTKRVLKALWEISRRDETEVKAEYEASVWAMRAAGMAIGTQLFLFDEPVEDQADAYNRALLKGREAGATGVNSTDNPFNGNQMLSQAWMEGYHEAQAALVLGPVAEGEADAAQ